MYTHTMHVHTHISAKTMPQGRMLIYPFPTYLYCAYLTMYLFTTYLPPIYTVPIYHPGRDYAYKHSRHTHIYSCQDHAALGYAIII